MRCKGGVGVLRRCLRLGKGHSTWTSIKPLIFLGSEEVEGGGVGEGVGGTVGLRGVGMLDAELHSTAQLDTESVCILFLLASLALFFFSAFFWAFCAFAFLAASSSADRVRMSAAAKSPPVTGVAVAGVGGGARAVGGEVLLMS